MQTFTESEDTRCCVNTIFPPEDGHVNARNMSRIIVLTNILLMNKENFALKLADEIILYYDARSKKTSNSYPCYHLYARYLQLYT